MIIQINEQPTEMGHHFTAKLYLGRAEFRMCKQKMQVDKSNNRQITSEVMIKYCNF